MFLVAFCALVFSAYFILSQNFQTILTDYTIKLVQAMVGQGVTTIEYELQSSIKEASALADSFSIPTDPEQKVDFPEVISQSDVLRTIYISENDSISSDGRKQDLHNQPDVLAAFGGKPTIYGPYFNEENEFVIRYSAPLQKQGEIVAVLSIEKDGYYFCELIQAIQFANSGESYIINADGTDIAVSRKDHLDWVTGQYNARQILQEKEDPVTRSILELEKKGLSGETGIGTYYWEGSLCYLAYAPIPSVDWVLLAGLRQEEIVSMMQSALYASIAKGPVLSICVSVFLLLTVVIIFWIFSSMKKSAEINEKLNVIANYDALTGAMNRNSYHAALDTLSSEAYRSLACIYIDANGLHEINNHLGHQAGDTMLKAVADALHYAFPYSKTYRIGGDEFVVFCQNQEQQEVYDKIELARETIKKQGYAISIGTVWQNQNLDINAMVNMAEEKMQQDKRKYYQENGKERQLRILDQKLEQMLLEKQDADTFLSVLAPEFKGVYFVDLGSDTIRHLFIPSYFDEMLKEADDIFSKALVLYANRIVMPKYRQQFMDFCDYTYLEPQIRQHAVPEFTYEKQDHTWIRLRVLKFKTYTAKSRETLWIFSDTENPNIIS